MKTITTYQLGPGCQKVLAAYIAFFVFLVVLIILTGCVRMPLPVIQDEALCPCPDLALAHHPEDPDSLGECRVKSRTGIAMDAGDHPACGREARKRGGGR